ncbi:armadillo-type protein [Parachaetomium inaequale]|uniref:Armadillo-type protein n=1 Tax=Parachaetomium inaequale TaxID=2588326 RepID=A0AAN6PHX3_9PEZI|nr:armadillo-type protein [Parachaetomium inaequale]
MATNSRRSRLSDYTGMPNGNHNAPPGLGNTLFGTGLPSSGPWNNNATGAFANTRPVVTPRDAMNAFATTGLGSGALTSTTDIDAWGAPYWNATDATQTRTLSGNTSPRSRSDASAHETNSVSNFFPGPSTMAQRGPVGSKPDRNTSNGAFKYPPGFSDYTDEGDGNQFMTQKFERGFPALAMATQRQAQEPSSLNAVGSGPSRKSISGLAEPDLPPQTSSFEDFTYTAPTAPAMHSQRPSLAGSSYSAHNNNLGFDQNVGRQLAETFGMMGLDNTPNGAMNALQDAMYGNGAQNFQFNPVSQPWENGQGYGNGFAKDTYGNGTSFEKRGSIVGRNSPAGSAYRTGGGLNSPRSFTGTPQPNADAWSRPTSRDPRMAAELARRGLADAQAQFAQQPAAPFFPNAFYPQNYAQNYAQFQPPYGPYSDPRHPAHMAGYGIPTPPYGLGTAAVPTRPARDQDPGKSLRSALLHEFKHSPKSRRWELKDIWTHIVEFSGDQQASRFIQQKLETANSDERDQVFAEIEPNAVQLMKDVFGNYVMQKLFEYGDQVQKKVLANAMKGKVVDLSMQPYACRVVQKALEHVLVEQQTELVKELESDLVKVAKDQHGNHVIQQAIVLVPREHIDFMMAGFKGHVYELASHQFGCRVVQRVLEHGTEADKASMMAELHSNTHMLVTDMYGNYVIQHVLEKGKPEDRAKMIDVITPQLLTLSRHKNASNVVEKCILLGTLEEQRSIRDTLVGDDSNSPLFQLMKDQFGNYVIRKFLGSLYCDTAVLVNKLEFHLQSLKKSGATSKQIEAMERLVTDFRVPVSAATSNNPTPASTAPTSPGLHVDVNSAAPTPNLTMDPNSPLSTPSSSPPYLNGDAVEPVNGHKEAASGQ